MTIGLIKAVWSCCARNCVARVKQDALRCAASGAGECEQPRMPINRSDLRNIPHRASASLTDGLHCRVQHCGPPQDKALDALDGGLAQSNGVALPTQRKLKDALGNQFGRWVSPVNKVQVP